MYHQNLTIRVAYPADAQALYRLAALDSSAALRGEVLLAERAGVPLAAVSLETGAVTADPFERTADAVRVLQLCRQQIARQRRDAAPARLLLRRVAPEPAG